MPTPTTIRGYQVRDGGLTDADIATANKDGAAATPCMRTLGTTAGTACAGNDSRLSDRQGRFCQGRLTLTSGTPVTTSDVTSAGTIYFTPYKGNLVSLYDGSAWTTHTFTERSLTISGNTSTAATFTATTTSGTNFLQSPSSNTGLVLGQVISGSGIPNGEYLVGIGSINYFGNSAGYVLASDVASSSATITVTATHSMYDVFMYNNSGTLTLTMTAWSNLTTRATALTTVDGTLVKSGDTGKLYLGTIRLSELTKTEDSMRRRFVWNNYNRVPYFDSQFDTSDSWTVTSHASWTTMNSASNQWRKEFVLGIAEDGVSADIQLASTYAGQINIAIDGIAPSRTKSRSGGVYPNTTLDMACQFQDYPSIGYHYLQGLEALFTAGSATFYGDNGGTFGAYTNAGMFTRGMR